MRKYEFYKKRIEIKDKVKNNSNLDDVFKTELLEILETYEDYLDTADLERSENFKMAKKLSEELYMTKYKLEKGNPVKDCRNCNHYKSDSAGYLNYGCCFYDFHGSFKDVKHLKPKEILNGCENFESIDYCNNLITITIEAYRKMLEKNKNEEIDVENFE